MLTEIVFFFFFSSDANGSEINPPTSLTADVWRRTGETPTEVSDTLAGYHQKQGQWQTKSEIRLGG
jgi:hypothetical protein